MRIINGARDITQISLDKAYDTSSFTIDGSRLISGLSPSNDEPRGVAFSANGLKLYIGRMPSRTM